MLDPGDPEFNPTYGAGRRCPRRRWVVTAEKSPPAGAGEALAVAGSKAGGDTNARPMSQRVGSVTSPQRDGGSRARGQGWAGSLWVPGGPGGTCLSAASVMALGTWQPGLHMCARVCVSPPLSFEAAAPLMVGNAEGVIADGCYRADPIMGTRKDAGVAWPGGDMPHPSLGWQG